LSINRGIILILSLFLAYSTVQYVLTPYHDKLAAESITDPTSGLSNTSNFSTYENSSFGMKMLYPSDWKKIEDFRGTWFRNSNDSVNVRVESIPYSNGALKELTARQINLTRQQFPGQAITELNSTTFLDGYPAHRIVFTYPEEPLDLQGVQYKKEMQVWSTRDGRAYIISYFTTTDAYDIYFPIIKKMVDSFEVIQGKNK
jgi:hypothetical protein